MPRAKDMTAIEVPAILRDRLFRMKRHERQACYEVIEAALDFYDDYVVPPANPLASTI
jgi:hypothetical protein